jgi:hypothetical protein
MHLWVPRQMHTYLMLDAAMMIEFHGGVSNLTSFSWVLPCYFSSPRKRYQFLSETKKLIMRKNRTISSTITALHLLQNHNYSTSHIIIAHAITSPTMIELLGLVQVSVFLKMLYLFYQGILLCHCHHDWTKGGGDLYIVSLFIHQLFHIHCSS